MIVSKRVEEKVWEGKKNHATVLGVSDGENVYLWKVKQPDYERGVLVPTPETFSKVSVRVTYCASEKGQITVQGTAALI